MTNRKTTRRALVLSLLSLLLCCSMLVGTTFAWFTDSVTSGNNKIVAGNLDVELYYKNDTTADWTKVTKDTNVFKTGTLWEPGHTEVVKLKVVNEGTLSLKYQLGVNVASETGSKNVLGKEFKLSDYIKFGVVEGDKSYDRAQAIAAVDATATALNVAYGTGTVKLDPKTQTNTDNEDIVTMVVYMPTTVENEANFAKGEAIPTILLGLNLYATQVEAEDDSFGTDYDKDAWGKEFKVYTAEDLQTAIDAGETNITLMDDITLDTAIVIPASASTYSLRASGITINMNGKSITTEAAYDNSNAGASSALVNNGVVTLVGEGEIKALNNYTVRNYGTMVIDGITVANGIMNFADLTVESGNISNSRTGKHTIYGNDAKLTLNGGRFHNDNPGNATIFAYAGEVIMNGGEYTIADGTATLGWTSCLLDAQGNAKYTINGGTVKGEIRDYNKNTTVYGGTFTHNSVKNFVADGYEAVANADGTYTVLFPQESFEDLINNAADGSTIMVPAGEYALRFTNNTAFNLDNLTIQGMGEVKLAISSSEVWYGRVQGSNVTFENIHFTTNVGATGKATYNDCTFADWAICASSNNEETYFNSCEIKGCLNTSTDFSSGDIYVKDSTVAKAEYSGAATMNFDGCTVGELVTWNMATNLNDTKVEKLDLSHVTSASVKIDGVSVVQKDDALKAAIAGGSTKVMLMDGEYDLNGIQKDGLVLTGIGTDAKVANTTRFASGKAVGAITKAITLENVTVTNTVYTMENGSNATFKNVNFAAGFRQGYGKNVKFEGCTFGSNTEGYALHFQTDAASEGGNITLTGCEFEGGNVHLGGKRAYTFTGCAFAAGTDFQVWSNITLDGCTVNGEEVTAANAASLFPKLDLTKVTFK